MSTRVGWCNRCASEILDEDAPGSCGCLLRHLARQKSQTVQARQAPLVPRVRQGALDHLASIHVVNPFTGSVSNQPQAGPFLRMPSTSAPQSMGDFVNSIFEGGTDPHLVSDQTLEGLWNTGPGDDVDAIPGGVPVEDGLSALWAEQVERETGDVIGSQGDLDSIWMNEISSPTGTTVANASNDIDFEIDFDTDIDAELARQPQMARQAARAPRPSTPRPPQAPEPRSRQQIGQSGRFPIMSERPTIPRAEAVAREPQRQGQRVMPPESVLTKTAKLSSKTTSYDQLMSDD